MAAKKNNRQRQTSAVAAWLDGAPAGVAHLVVNEKAGANAGEQIYAHDWPSLVAAEKREIAEMLVDQSEAWADAAGRECGFIARFVNERGESVSACQWRVSGLDAGEVSTPYDGTTEGIIRQMQGHVQHLMKVNHDQMRIVVQALQDANAFQATRIRELESIVKLTNGVTELKILQDHAASEMAHETLRFEHVVGAVPKLLEAINKKDAGAVVAAANDLRQAVQGTGPAAAESAAEPTEPKAAE